jgi:hypothetical protein
MGPEAVDELAVYVHEIMDNLKHIVDEGELQCGSELRRTFNVQLDREEGWRLKEVYDTARKEGRWTMSVDFIDETIVEHVTSIKGVVSAISGPACSFWPYEFVTQLLSRLIDSYPSIIILQTTTPVTSITSSP